MTAARFPLGRGDARLLLRSSILPSEPAMKPSRSIHYPVLLLGLSGALAAPAGAAEPLIQSSSFIVDHELMANCGDFQIFADGYGSMRLTTFFDRDGQPIRVALHGVYNGIMTNSVSGATLSDSPSVANITFDLVAGTQTNIGAYFTVTTPGEGTVLIEAGRIQFDGSGPPTFIAGPHLPPSDTLATLCEALR
jgi:hypothetical protein